MTHPRPRADPPDAPKTSLKHNRACDGLASKWKRSSKASCSTKVKTSRRGAAPSSHLLRAGVDSHLSLWGGVQQLGRDNGPEVRRWVSPGNMMPESASQTSEWDETRCSRYFSM